MNEIPATLVLLEDDGSESLVDSEQLRTTVAVVLEKMIRVDESEYLAAVELWRIQRTTSTAYARLVARELVAIFGPWLLHDADESQIPAILARLHRFVLNARRLSGVGGPR